jgi:hypothetical protein
MLKWIFKKKEEAITRDSERFDVTVRVKSRQLPGYRALTLDISGSGLQIETEGLLEKGKILELEMEFDRPELPDFTCPAQVMWAKTDDSRRQHLAGLAFQPETHEQKLNLARMGTVLETRSESDIKDLLQEANRLDATREAFFAQKENLPTHPLPVAQPAQPQPQAPVMQSPAPVPFQVPAQPQAAPPPQPSAPPSHPGVLIPLDIRINGYLWDRAHGHLILKYWEGEQSHELVFPNCQDCHDCGCGANQKTVGFLATVQSERVRQLQAQRGNSPWRHYRFIGPGHEAVLEIISLPCQSRQ